ncbi:MAG: hypothetical protein IKL13_01255 [Clostridia bacterium]|nr:hypothetical protein [Clostridia bacterium]
MKTVIFAGASLLFGGMTLAFGLSLCADQLLALAIPCVVGLFGFILSLYLLLRQVFTGDTLYWFADSNLYAKNKQGTCAIPKEAVRNVTFVYDRRGETIAVVWFCHGRKRHAIHVDENNLREIQTFFSQDEVKQGNVWYDIVEWLTV